MSAASIKITKLSKFAKLIMNKIEYIVDVHLCPSCVLMLPTEVIHHYIYHIHVYLIKFIVHVCTDLMPHQAYVVLV